MTSPSPASSPDGSTQPQNQSQIGGCFRRWLPNRPRLRLDNEYKHVVLNIVSNCSANLISDSLAVVHRSAPVSGMGQCKIFADSIRAGAPNSSLKTKIFHDSMQYLVLLVAWIALQLNPNSIVRHILNSFRRGNLLGHATQFTAFHNATGEFS